MNPKLLLLTIALALSLQGCAPSPPAENPLSGKWFFAVGRETDTPADAARYAYRPLSSLAGLDLHHPDRRGVLWLKTGFTVPPSLRGKELALMPGFINPCDITFVNGHEIGRGGIAPWGGDHFFSDWNSYRRYDINTALLQEGENTLLIKFYANYEGSIGGRMLLGDRETIGRIWAVEGFFRTEINAIIAAIMLIIGLYHLLIYARRPKDRENLYYSLLCIFFALYQTNFFITRVPLGVQYLVPYIAHQKLILSSLYASGIFGILFINAYLKIRAPRPLVIAAVAFLGAAVLAVTAAPEYRIISLYSKTLNAAAALVTLTYVLAAMIIMTVKKSRPARVMMLGLAPFAACTAFDVITHNLLLLDNYIYLSGFGFSAFLISIMFILANDFVTYHNEVEVLNVTLDQKVEERTAELLRAKQETEKAMAEIEKAHANQKALNRELAHAHDIMKRDMDLAANVQSSFYPRRPPEIKGWDIAFMFRPMSGVSGDLYDFFLAGDDLYGVSLFDVSGHGVSSGLITMLVKSVLHRNFLRGRELTLNQLLQRMNRELIQEMGSIDNYLTGILLRFAGDKAEYVNAGHTDLIMKNGKTGEARIVTSGNERFRGHFLGVDSMDELYAMLRFSVREGDSLLLYTDCLIESRNKGGEQYGLDRLLRAFSAVDVRQGAQEQLDHLMADLHRHAGTHSLGDDLTAIILKKSV